jgi:hypothetical protein
MDKLEAERVAGAIRKMNMEWIRVSGVEHNPLTDTYEVKCVYKRERGNISRPTDPWTTILIKSPRQWIDLLTGHRDDFELP